MLWVPHDNKLQYPVAWARVRGELCLPVPKSQPVPETKKIETPVVLKETKPAAIQSPPEKIVVVQPRPALPIQALAEEKISTLFFRRLGERIRSGELWLGLLVAAIAHIAMRGIVGASFVQGHILSVSAANNILCLGTGAAIGMGVYATRLFYRNFKLAPGKKKQKFYSRAFVVTSMTGVAGGILGCGVVNIGAAIIEAGILPFSITAGVIFGIPFVLLTEPETSRRKWTAAEWGERALWGAGFGIAGGLAGAMFADLFSSHSAIVAALDNARWALFPSHTEISYAATMPAAIPPPPVIQAVAMQTPVIQTTVFMSPDNATVYAQAIEVARHALPRTN